MVKYLRGAGVVVALLAGIAMTALPDYFESLVFLTYASMFIWTVDFYCEVRARRRRVVVVGALVVFALFTFGFVWISAPLTIETRLSTSQYPSGTMIGAIKWSPKFSELRIRIINRTSYDYYNLDITIRPDKPVAGIGKITSFPEVSFLERMGTPQLESVDLSSEKGTAFPMEFLASSMGFRVYCEKLPTHTEIELVMALVSVDVAARGLLAVKMSDDSHSWYINKDELLGDITSAYGSQPIPSRVHIEGQYVVLQRRRTVKEELKVTSLLAETLKRLPPQK